MKKEKNQLAAVILAGVCCFTAFCSVPGGNALAEEADGISGVAEDILTPEVLVLPALEEYEMPSMGLIAALPESLREQMEQKEVALLMDNILTQDGTALWYGYLSFNRMTPEQWDTQLDMTSDDYQNWQKGLDRIGCIGVYQEELTGKLEELTGCDEHQKLGESSDGGYQYYLSTNTKAEEALLDEIKEIKTTIIDMQDDLLAGAFEMSSEDSEMPAAETNASSLGEFTTQDINGETYTQELFQDYDLTMINVFTTWCTPCVEEIPALDSLYREKKDQGVNVVGVVLDVLDEKGEIVPESLERAKLLAEKTGAAYPILLPDSSYLNGRLIGIEAFPETFFVDKNGTIVGETYSGSGSLEDWEEVVEKELANVKEGM